ncbi:MAG: hypothetical protein H7844_04065 [Nitrospirae bacterium YQR-1]
MGVDGVGYAGYGNPMDSYGWGLDRSSGTVAASDGRSTGTEGGDASVTSENGLRDTKNQSGKEVKDTVEIGSSKGRSKEEQEKIDREVQKLKQRDQEVRAHELAHQSVGGRYAGSPRYEYQNGPDGKRYISGGEVSIDTSEEKDPEATVSKMRQVRASAMAPANPSSQDMKVAQEASQKEATAQQEVSRKSFEKQQGGDEQTQGTTGAEGGKDNAQAQGNTSRTDQSGESAVVGKSKETSDQTDRSANNNFANITAAYTQPTPNTKSNLKVSVYV